MGTSKQQQSANVNIQTAPPSPLESTALLSHPKTRTPLPIAQLTLICIVRLAEPVASSQIFPYINDLCVEFGYAKTESDVGFISGLIEALFALVQLLTVALWGRLSDRIGRKPVVLIGLLGVTGATLLFGLSRSLWLTILARCLAGGLSGNSAVIQTMISEVTDESNESQAFPLYSLMWTLGSIVGPTFGGTLSRPAEQFPDTFSAPFWTQFPYFLPCLASAGTTGISIVTSLFLRETLPRKHTTPPSADRSPQLQPSYSTLPAPAPQPTAWQILRSPGIPTVFVTAFMMMLTTQAWDVVFPLFAFTSIRAGGLSLSDAQIGYLLASAGFVGACVHLFLFPAMERRFGIKMYPWLLAFPMGMYAYAPALNGWLRSRGGEHWKRGHVDVGTIVGAGGLLLMGRLAAMVYPLNMMLVKRAAPSRAGMGSTYGMSQMVTSFARTIGPWGVSSLFAFSAEHNLLGGNLIWLAMACVSAVAVVQSLRVERSLDGRAREVESESEAGRAEQDRERGTRFGRDGESDGGERDQENRGRGDIRQREIAWEHEEGV
ncbi:MFS general substrate transporter [Dacryopinax primogenitus]|uniref:MFS general substrate transporter n=1 Tax=Dacryopinax primogenitus (strain DJM 731) TaxID=1858805 RepID=M5G1V9_DACPD|nr:MFS general substrate transporter [Dacryopinax primogenitus]EJT97732.1 MFS general substrate transporter [Dacryopinax primogenitus]